MSKAGLILEGGGMRGVYTAGVLDYFDEQGLFFRFIVGVSAGACNSVSYVSHQKGRSFEIDRRFCRDKRYIDPLGLAKNGEIFRMDFLFHDIPDDLLPFDYDAYKSAGCENYAVITSLETGEAEYCRVADMRTDADFVRASSSLPMFAKVVDISGKKYLDGGVADSIPGAFSVQSGNDVQVFILTRHKGYIKKKSRLSPLCARRYKAYPDFVKAYETRYQRYNESVRYAEQLEAEGRAIIIRPRQPVKVGNFARSPEQLEKLYRQGYEDACAVFERVTTFVKDCENVSFSGAAQAR